MSLVSIIVFTFLITLSYLLAHEYFNMKHNMIMNYALHHFMNKSILQGISIFMKLTSMVSILGYILHISSLSLSISSGIFVRIILIVVFSIIFGFVFILSDITFNEFIYRRNKYIFSYNKEIKGDRNDIFIKPIKIINNETRDRMPKAPHVTYIRTNHGKTNNVLKHTKQLIHLCKLKSWYVGDIKNNLSEFYNLIRMVNLHNHVSKYDINNLKFHWFNFDYRLNKNHLNITGAKSLDKLNYYKMKVTKALYK